MLIIQINGFMALLVVFSFVIVVAWLFIGLTNHYNDNKARDHKIKKTIFKVKKLEDYLAESEYSKLEYFMVNDNVRQIQLLWPVEHADELIKFCERHYLNFDIESLKNKSFELILKKHYD